MTHVRERAVELVADLRGCGLKSEKVLYAYQVRAPRLARVAVVHCTASQVQRYFNHRWHEVGFLTHLYVNRGLRRQGFAHALLGAAVQEADRRDLPLVTYAQPFDQDGPEPQVLRRLYRRYGFRVLHGMGEDGWLQRCPTP